MGLPEVDETSQAPPGNFGGRWPGQLQPYIPSGIPGEAPALKLGDYAVEPVKVWSQKPGGS